MEVVMEENEFASTLDKKIQLLANQRQEKMDNLLNGNWHAGIVEKSLQSALGQLEKSDPAELSQLLVSLIEQVPDLIRNIWTSGIDDVKVLESEIGRWKEMQQYYSDHLKSQEVIKLKKNVEEDKNKVEYSSAAIEKARETLKSEIASGNIEEPSKMKSIRRQTGTHPGPTLSDYRSIKRDLEVEQTTAEDDSAR